MSTPIGITPPDEPFAPPPQESETPWVPIIIGAVVVIVVIGLIVLFTVNRGGPPANSTADPYAANIAIGNLTLSTAENFAGQEVTYLEGAIKNNGPKTVDGITLQISFKNSLGEIVQRENQPLMVITAREPYVDTSLLKNAPLHSGQTREFRLTFEHISADWDRQTPVLLITRVSKQ